MYGSIERLKQTTDNPNLRWAGGEGMDLLYEHRPQLAKKIERTGTNDSHVFDEAELIDLAVITSDYSSSELVALLGDVRLACGYAAARWSEGDKPVVVSYMDNKGQFRESNLAALWHRFPGETEAEKLLAKMQFYMNYSRAEAEEYLNAYKGEDLVSIRLIDPVPVTE